MPKSIFGKTSVTKYGYALSGLDINASPKRFLATIPGNTKNNAPNTLKIPTKKAPFCASAKFFPESAF